MTARAPRESRARRTRAGRVPREIRAVDPGSWERAAITAALREWAATAVALRAAGESVRPIAEQLGVHLRTAHRYLAAGTCPGCGGPRAGRRALP